MKLAWNIPHLKIAKVWWWGLAGLVMVLILAFGTIFVVNLRGLSGSAKNFTIHDGENRRSIASRLEQEGFIRSSFDFLVLSYVEHRTLLAGTFTLSPEASVSTVLETLSSTDKRQITITIPEGWRREQIADYLATKGINKADFLTQTADLEGQLFPDTYFLSMNPQASEVVTKMTTNYRLKTDSLNVTAQQLIIASIVEREAKADTDRPLIAGIYLNRLNQGMSLDADPTVQYARDTQLLASGSDPSPFWGPITVSDYHSVISPYNTYLNTGLPPGPIANPGLKSIDAAVHPAATDALYFFHTAGGQIITSKTIEEHNANKAKYLN